MRIIWRARNRVPLRRFSRKAKNSRIRAKRRKPSRGFRSFGDHSVNFVFDSPRVKNDAGSVHPSHAVPRGFSRGSRLGTHTPRDASVLDVRNEISLDFFYSRNCDEVYALLRWHRYGQPLCFATRFVLICVRFDETLFHALAFSCIQLDFVDENLHIADICLQYNNITIRGTYSRNYRCAPDNVPFNKWSGVGRNLVGIIIICLRYIHIY